MKATSASARRGLLAGGNWIIDQVKIIDVYPQPEQLANIRSQSQGTGGGPYNVLMDLARAGAPFPLLAAGMVGRDTLGAQILADCKAHKINTRYLRTTPQAPTSYTDVMTEANGGRRTFFHARAHALWNGAPRLPKSRPDVSPGLPVVVGCVDQPDATPAPKPPVPGGGPGRRA